MEGFFDQGCIAGSCNISGNESVICYECGLLMGCFTPKMSVHGQGNSDVMIVAEAPGESEDRQGVPLVGKAGQRLRELLNELGVDLDQDCWKTNSVVCRPPANARPTPRQIELCRQRLFKNIRSLGPRVIIPLGECSVESIIGPEWGGSVRPLARWVGHRIPSRKFNAWLCPTYHPSYLIRVEEKMPALKTIMMTHLENAFDQSTKGRPFGDSYELPSGGVPVWEKESVEIMDNAKDIARRLRGIRKAGGTIAFDFETTGLKPYHADHKIVSCSICYDGAETFSFLLLDQEPLVLNGLRKLLADPTIRKVAANTKFETLWSKWKLGVDVQGWIWDTMLVAHYLDNRKHICGLKFQSYVQFGVPDYSAAVSPYLKSSKGASDFNRILDLVQDSKTELLVYNGLDSLFEYKLFEKQKEAFDSL